MHRVVVHIGPKSYSLEVPTGANLLLHAVSHSVPIPFHCTTGRCTTCRVRIISGNEHLNDFTDQELYRLPGEALDRGERLACQIYVYGDITVEVADEHAG
ncbi:2Fe-2S iron-sulfur cluster-binding protein [Lihuaxuella thermophila]|nr:2Fe-2S iron-sulfur cluster-binding protein [Lihuaxuella thermophila]